MLGKPFIAVSCLAVAFAVAPSQAWAGNAAALPLHGSQWQSELRFDLLRDCPKPQTDTAAAKLVETERIEFAENRDSQINGWSSKEELGPSWSVQRGQNGPVLQFAALGAGKKDRPGLAHLAIDWNF